MRSEVADRRAAIANRLSLVVIAGYFALESTRRLIVLRRFDVESLGDFMINLSRSQQILARGSYGDHFYYPVPFLLLQEAIGRLGLPAASLLWFATVVAASVAVCWLCLDALGLARHRWRWVLSLAACLGVVYFLQWDLRAGNSNVVILALVLASLRLGRKRSDLAAGGLLSLAIALKLYAAVLIPYLVWRRRWRWLGAASVAVIALFVGWPWLRLGAGEAWALSHSWLAHLLDPGPVLSLPDYYKPLGRSLLLLFTEAGGSEHSLVAWSPEGVVAGTRAIQAVWVAAIAFQIARSRSWADEGERLHADAAVLLLGPLVFSPTFQAHHAVVLLLTAFWMVRIAADPDESSRRRWAAGLLLVLAALMVKAVQPWPARAVAIAGAMALHLAALCSLPPRAPGSVATPRDPPPA
ncbi:MAG: glycosyltransferase family 87 protein [Myxococcota bacterium]